VKILDSLDFLHIGYLKLHGLANLWSFILIMMQ